MRTSTPLRRNVIKCHVGHTKINLDIRFNEHLRKMKNQEEYKSSGCGTIKSVKLLTNVNNIIRNEIIYKRSN